MAYEEMGYGGVGGLIVAALTFLGWNRRLNKLEDLKQDTKVCNELHRANDSDHQMMKTDLKYIRDRIDVLINGK